MKPNVQANNKLLIVKGKVHASMKNANYLVYVHLEQNGEKCLHEAEKCLFTCVRSFFLRLFHLGKHRMTGSCLFCCCYSTLEQQVNPPWPPVFSATTDSALEVGPLTED